MFNNKATTKEFYNISKKACFLEQKSILFRKKKLKLESHKFY